MRFEVVQNLKEGKFRRLTGAKLKTFNEIAEIVEQALPEKKPKGGGALTTNPLKPNCLLQYNST